MSRATPVTSFGQADELVNPARQPLEANLVMDKDGKAAIPIVLPADAEDAEAARSRDHRQAARGSAVARSNAI